MPAPGFVGQPAAGSHPASRPANHLVWSLVTILLCWPLAIPAIIFSAQVNGRWNLGDAAGAAESSRRAKLFAISATVVGALGWTWVMTQSTTSGVSR